AAQMAILESYAALQNQTTEDTSSQAGSNEIPQASGFYRPTSGVMTLPYMSTEYPYSAARPHLGVDYGAAEGTPVVAVADGVVIQASYGDNGGYGNMIVISHNVNGTPMVSIYGHLSSISVSAGQTISGGEYIGAVGNTGQSFGAHLHIELLAGINYMPAGREERQSYTVNPANYF
ncbi:MAG: M23 family metallopeptidase, partial [Culicoidibacterales bacterium]